MKIYGGLHASSSFNWIFSLILITACCFRAAVATTERSCGIACPLNYDPLCGSDGVTYSNECGLTAANCRSNKSITVAHRGRCREAVTTTKRSCDFACALNYDPVCGSDGVTYSNECALTAANCRSRRRITKARSGSCSRAATTTERSCDILCPLNYDPLCGSDGVTYGNECGLTAANCRSNKSITVAHRGRCREAVTTTERSCGFLCAANYDPVCGSDGVTYSNECSMNAANCRSGRSITKAHRGRCSSTSRDVTTTERSCDFACALNYDPVCGSDGVTYSNECELTAANCRSRRRITKARSGSCSRERNCDSACPANYDPVCGSDGTTYGNRCELRSHRCMNQTRLRVACKGICKRDRRSSRLTCRRYPSQN